MGFQYRKSIKVLPGVRMTVSKSGVSYSAGVKGARMTKTASGRVTRTVGLPGTGMYHTSSVSSVSSVPSSKARQGAAEPAPPKQTPVAKPGLLAPKGERALYKAIQSQDVSAIEAVAQQHPDYALVAASAAGLSHCSARNVERATELLTWVFDSGKDPAEEEFFRKYLRGSMELEIADGITAELPVDRQSLGLMLAELRQAQSDIEGAIDVVERLEPTTLAAVSLAELYTVARRFDDVIDLTNGLSNEDDATAILLVFRGHALRMLGHYTASRETLRDALRSSKRDSAILQRALIERAYAYLGEGKKSQAKKDAEKVIAQDRSHPLLPNLLMAIEPETAVAPEPTLPPRGSNVDPGWAPPSG